MFVVRNAACNLTLNVTPVLKDALKGKLWEKRKSPRNDVMPDAALCQS